MQTHWAEIWEQGPRLRGWIGTQPEGCGRQEKSPLQQRGLPWRAWLEKRLRLHVPGFHKALVKAVSLAEKVRCVLAVGAFASAVEVVVEQRLEFVGGAVVDDPAGALLGLEPAQSGQTLFADQHLDVILLLQLRDRRVGQLHAHQ